MSTKVNTEKDQKIDPVCNMVVSSDSPYHYYYANKDYYFCSEHCFHKFKDHPEQYMNKESPPSLETHGKLVIYTCPMHPEIIRDKPGSCPKCGMALEPKTASMTEGESNPEYEDMRKRFIVGAILTLPLLIIAMRDMIPGGRLLDTLATARTYEWLELLLATPVVLWAGWPFFVRGVQSVINKSLNMFTLIGLGVSVAYL